MNKINRVIYCLIDDLRSSHFFDFIERGLLPNFKKLMENGIYSKTCITDFPSVTYPCQASLITGTYTGDFRKEMCHGIPSFNWMGRDVAPPELRSYGSTGSNERIQVYKLNDDLGPNCRTIFEMINEGNCTSISQFINRGYTYYYPESKIRFVLLYLYIKYALNLKKMILRINDKVVHQLLENFRSPKKFFPNNEPPICSLLLFFTPDMLMHMYGYDSQIYKLNLMHIDKCIGILVDKLDELGYLDDTAIAIISDHGNYRANKTGDLSSFYNLSGLKNYHPRKNSKGNIYVAEFNGVGYFYFKGTNKTNHPYEWSKPTNKELESYGPKKINLFEELLKIKGSRLIYYGVESNTYLKGTIHLKRYDRKIGKIYTGQIEYKGIGEDYKTRYISEDDTNDIFGYLEDDIASKLVNDKFHSIEEWMACTHHLDYPIYPDLISRHFKNPRSSDIIVSTKGKVAYDNKHGKKKEKRKYLHDIGLRKCAIVPLIISGSSEIPLKEIKHCKTTDIVPTLLKMLGKNPHRSVIGKSLI